MDVHRSLFSDKEIPQSKFFFPLLPLLMVYTLSTLLQQHTQNQRRFRTLTINSNAVMALHCLNSKLDLARNVCRNGSLPHLNQYGTDAWYQGIGASTQLINYCTHFWYSCVAINVNLFLENSKYFY